MQRPPFFRNRLAIAIAAAVFGGAVALVAPSGAHVADWNHNWFKHIKPRTDARYYTKAQSNTRHYTKAQSNTRYYTNAQSNSRYVAKSATIRGVYYLSGQAAGSNEAATTEISFGVTFPAPPSPHFIALGEPVPAGCSGNAAMPGAAQGHLCVFENTQINAPSRGIIDPSGGTQASRFGAGIYIYSGAGALFLSAGSWAATPK